MWKVCTYVGPRDPHHHLERPEGGASGRFPLDEVKDDIRDDGPRHGVTGGTARACLTSLFCLDYLSLVCEGLGGVRPPVRSVPLHHPLQHHPNPLADHEAGQVSHASLPLDRDQQGEDD